jgi:VWFA-related protein
MPYRFSFLCVMLACSFLPASSQTAIAPANNPSSANPVQNQPPTFHATSRLVLVDVVVTGKKGEFVRNLKPADFTVLEDGRPQSITAFAAHMASASPQPPPKMQLPEHQYTNYNAPPPDHPITIILLDMLNTLITERPYAREQMLKFLRAMPPGQPIALFTLSGTLRMVQGFTQSSDALTAAAKSVLDKNENAHLHTTEADLEDAEATDADLAAMAGRLPASAVALSEGLIAEQQYQLDVRVRSTLGCLKALAQSVAGYPGRKNLIWLAGDFPVALGPEVDSDPRLSSRLLYQSEVHETSGLLASSQIAVYPIDVRGLEIIGAGLGSRRAQTAVQRSRVLDAQWNTQFTMKEIAKETGGEAFYNQNDLSRLMQRSLDEGTNYYTVAYVPENHDWNGRYRKIEVKLAMSDLKVRHRSGYFAFAEKSSDRNSAVRLLAAAMQPTVPESTRLLMKVQVLPPDTNRKTVSIDFAVSPADLAFTDGPDQHKLTTVDFMAVALDRNLREAAEISNTVDANLRPQTYDGVLKTGFPGHLELDLKPGKYVLRLGAIDRNNEKIGTVDVPMNVPAETAQK